MACPAPRSAPAAPDAPSHAAAERLARTLAERVAARAAELGAAASTEPSPALAALRRRLEPEDAAGLDRLRHGWHARLQPLDEPERAATDAIVAVLWRQGALAGIEERLCRDLLAGDPPAALRTLALLCRYRQRLAKDREAAERDYRTLTRSRPQARPIPELNPERLEWLAAKMRLDRERAEAAPPAAAPRHAAPEPGPTVGPRPGAELDRLPERAEPAASAAAPRQAAPEPGPAAEPRQRPDPERAPPCAEPAGPAAVGWPSPRAALARAGSAEAPPRRTAAEPPPSPTGGPPRLGDRPVGPAAATPG